MITKFYVELTLY